MGVHYQEHEGDLNWPPWLGEADSRPVEIMCGKGTYLVHWTSRLHSIMSGNTGAVRLVRSSPGARPRGVARLRSRIRWPGTSGRRADRNLPPSSDGHLLEPSV